MNQVTVWFDIESGGVETQPSVMSREQWNVLEKWGHGPKPAFDVGMGIDNMDRLATTWKYCAGSPITQIGAAAVDESFEVIDTFEVKLGFRMELATEEALWLSSFDKDVWRKEARRVRPALECFSAFLRRHKAIEMLKKDGSGTYKVAQLAGHNIAKFDQPMLERHYQDPEWQRCALPGDPPRAEPVDGMFLPGSFSGLDTLQLARWWNRFCVTGSDRPVTCSVDDAHYGGPGVTPDAHRYAMSECPECGAPLKPSLSLPVIARYFGIEHNPHDALADVLANVQIGRRLLEEVGMWKAAI